MRLIGWYIQAWRNSFQAKGRARRGEYWTFTLFNMAIWLWVALLLGGTSIGNAAFSVSLVLELATIPASITVGIRRLHDIGKSGKALLLALIPIVGGLLLLIYYGRPGTLGPNKYGPDPKA